MGLSYVGAGTIATMPIRSSAIPDRPIAEREKRLRLLLDVGRSLVSELELDVVLERVLEAGRELTGARYAAIGVLDEQRNALERFITLGIDEETHRAIGDLPRGRGVLGVLITEPEPLRLDDVGRHPRSYGFPSAHPPMHSFLGVPIRVRDVVYGNLYLTEKAAGGVFDAEDEEVVVVLAEWAAVAIDNARSYASAESRRIELERAVAGLEATTAIAHTLAGETELESVLELIVKRGRALADARSMVVMLPRGNDLVVRSLAGDLDHELVGVNVPLEGSVSGHVFRSGRSERFSDASLRLRGAFEKQTEATSGLFVPLLFRGRVLGVLAAFDRFGEPGTFSASDEHVLTGFAASAAAAVATAQDVAAQTGRRGVAAAESERARWARELHDDTLQELAGLKLLLGAVRRSEDPGERQRILEDASGRIDIAIRSLRGLITDLRPVALDDLGLGPALAGLIDRVRQAGELTIELTVDLAHESGRETIRLDREIEECIYRLVQECLSNVAKHARASNVHVSVRESAETVEVTVRDDGVGFDGAHASSGFGLMGMRERVALTNGSMKIVTEPERGTAIMLQLPASRGADGHETTIAV